MPELNRKRLRALEDQILRGLASFYYDSGHKSADYRDPETGGVYEHKLASKLGFQLESGSPPEFIEACHALEAQGLVRRNKRKPDFPEYGIWPTLQGLDRAEYLEASVLGKLAKQLAKRWPEIAVSVLTTIATLLVSWFLGLFGLKAP